MLVPIIHDDYEDFELPEPGYNAHGVTCDTASGLKVDNAKRLYLSRERVPLPHQKIELGSGAGRKAAPFSAGRQKYRKISINAIGSVFPLPGLARPRLANAH